MFSSKSQVNKCAKLRVVDDGGCGCKNDRQIHKWVELSLPKETWGIHKMEPYFSTIMDHSGYEHFHPRKINTSFTVTGGSSLLKFQEIIDIGSKRADSDIVEQESVLQWGSHTSNATQWEFHHLKANFNDKHMRGIFRLFPGTNGITSEIINLERVRAFIQN